MTEISLLPSVAVDLNAVLAHCRVALNADGEARRLLHGRGRCWPGLEQVCIDAFPPLLLVTFFKAPEPAFEQALVAELRDWLPRTSLNCLAVQRRYGEEGGGTRFEVMVGELPLSLTARESDLAYGIEPTRGQNVGFFLDMREARQWLRTRALGKSVLNLFAFTCAFSVVARAGGAARVVNIDLSRASLTQGRENHRRNGQPLEDIHFLDHDVFRSWSKLHKLGRYDVIVMDPPTLQKGSFNVERDYGKVVRRFSKLLKPQSDVLACLNAPHLGEGFLDEVFARELPGSVKVMRLPNPPEFADSDPQASLKVVHYRYERPADLPPLGDDD